MADPALHSAALAGLEFLVNKALQLDPATLNRLAELDGKVLKIHCQTPDITVYCVPASDGIRFKAWQDESQVNSALSGKLSDFIQLLQAEDKAAALINGELSVHGDSNDFIQLQAALAELDIDWEQPLTRLFGDVGAHQLGKMIRGTISWGKHANQSLSRQVEEFIHEEGRLLPPRLELENFYSDVSALSLRVDRLEARLQRFRQRLAAEG